MYSSFKFLLIYALKLDACFFVHLKDKIDGGGGGGGNKLQGGDKIKASIAKTSGTLGYFVRCENSLGIISNAHVLEEEGCEVLRLPEGGTETPIGKVEKVMIVNNLLGFL